MEKLILGKNDKPISLRLKDETGNPVDFVDMQDVEVVLAINKLPVATYRIAPGEGEFEVLPVDGEPAMCKFMITVAQQQAWGEGLLQMQVTLVTGEPDFPEGRHSGQIADLYYCIKGL